MKHNSILFILGILWLTIAMASCAPQTQVQAPASPTLTQPPPTETQPLPTSTPTSTYTPTPTATSTPLALEDKDLSLVGIHLSDLPSEYTDVITTTTPEDFADFFDDFPYGLLHNCYLGGFEDPGSGKSLYSIVWVYANDFIASKTYSQWSDANTNDEPTEIPLIGAESSASIFEGGALVIWRHGEAVAWVAMYGDEQPDMDELVRLAQLVQTRLVEQQVARPPTPTAPPVTATETQTTDTTLATPTPTQAEIGRSRSNPYPFGQYSRTTNWDIQVLEVKRGEAAWQALQAASTKNDPAPEGKEYVLVKLYVKCLVADSDAHRVSFTDFGITGDSYVQRLFGVMIEPSPDFGSQELKKGEEAAGWMGYEIDMGEGNLELVFEDFTNYESFGNFYFALEPGASISLPAELVGPPNDLGIDSANPAPMGESVITENFKITVLEMVRGDEAWKMLQEVSSYNDPPLDTGEYVLVRVHVFYIGKIDRDVDSLEFLFGILDHDDISYGIESIITAPEPHLYGELFPGGEAEGWIAFQVPKGDRNIRLVFEPYYYFNESPRYLALEP